MAVLLHALFALVLVDLRFPAFLDGAHGGYCDGWLAVKESGERIGSGNKLVERILDDAFRAETLEVGDDVSYHDFVNHRFNRHPAGLGELGDGRAPQ